MSLASKRKYSYSLCLYMRYLNIDVTSLYFFVLRYPQFLLFYTINKNTFNTFCHEIVNLKIKNSQIYNELLKFFKVIDS